MSSPGVEWVGCCLAFHTWASGSGNMGNHAPRKDIKLWLLLLLQFSLSLCHPSLCTLFTEYFLRVTLRFTWQLIRIFPHEAYSLWVWTPRRFEETHLGVVLLFLPLPHYSPVGKERFNCSVDSTYSDFRGNYTISLFVLHFLTALTHPRREGCLNQIEQRKTWSTFDKTRNKHYKYTDLILFSLESFMSISENAKTCCDGI